MRNVPSIFVTHFAQCNNSHKAIFNQIELFQRYVALHFNSSLNLTQFVGFLRKDAEVVLFLRYLLKGMLLLLMSRLALIYIFKLWNLFDHHPCFCLFHRGRHHFHHISVQDLLQKCEHTAQFAESQHVIGCISRNKWPFHEEEEIHISYEKLRKYNTVLTWVV